MKCFTRGCLWAFSTDEFLWMWDRTIVCIDDLLRLILELRTLRLSVMMLNYMMRCFDFKGLICRSTINGLKMSSLVKKIFIRDLLRAPYHCVITDLRFLMLEEVFWEELWLSDNRWGKLPLWHHTHTLIELTMSALNHWGVHDHTRLSFFRKVSMHWVHLVMIWSHL